MGGTALAELGFIVVQIDGRGTPMRDKAFFDHSYGRYDRASDLDDHIAGIRQLAERYPSMDLDRVGTTTYSGGTGPVQGLLRYPEFFKVGVAATGFHDVRTMSAQIQADKYQGVAGGEAGYHSLEEDAACLQGKLFLIIGMLDTVTPPCAAFRLVEALHQANKDFDMLALPNLGRGSLPSANLERCVWDYLVTHLQGLTPPREYCIASATLSTMS